MILIVLGQRQRKRRNGVCVAIHLPRLVGVGLLHRRALRDSRSRTARPRQSNRQPALSFKSAGGGSGQVGQHHAHEHRHGRQPTGDDKQSGGKSQGRSPGIYGGNAAFTIACRGAWHKSRGMRMLSRGAAQAAAQAGRLTASRQPAYNRGFLGVRPPDFDGQDDLQGRGARPRIVRAGHGAAPRPDGPDAVAAQCCRCRADSRACSSSTSPVPSSHAEYENPVLVSCTDGVGTKLKVASLSAVHDTVGIDLVAMSVNDALCCGAEPLFFLDYVAMSKDDPPLLEQIVSGITAGCLASDSALLGGETAIMPDLYSPGDYDLAGFCVGVVERHRHDRRPAIAAGDVVLGFLRAACTRTVTAWCGRSYSSRPSLASMNTSTNYPPRSAIRC